MRLGAALALMKLLPKTALSENGAQRCAWWPTPRKAVIQLTARHEHDGTW